MSSQSGLHRVKEKEAAILGLMQGAMSGHKTHIENAIQQPR